MRLLLLGCLVLAACSAPPQAVAPVLTDSTAAVVAEVPKPPIELLRDGDVLLDREPPPFPDSVLADSIREVMRTGPYATAMVSTEAYGLDSLGHEVPIEEALREVAAEIPEGARAYVQFIVAWDGRPIRAEVVRVVGAMPAAVVRDALAHIHFRPTWFDMSAPDIPRSTPIPYSTYYSIPFSRSWLD